MFNNWQKNCNEYFISLQVFLQSFKLFVATYNLLQNVVSCDAFLIILQPTIIFQKSSLNIFTDGALWTLSFHCKLCFFCCSDWSSLEHSFESWIKHQQDEETFLLHYSEDFKYINKKC